MPFPWPYPYIILFDLCPNAKSAKFNSTPNLVVYSIKYSWRMHRSEIEYHARTTSRSLPFYFLNDNVLLPSNLTTNWVNAMTQMYTKKSVSLKNISCLEWQSNQNELNPLIKASQIRDKFICIKAWHPFSLLRPGFFTSTSCKCVVKLIWDKRTSPCSAFTWLNSYKECSLIRSRCLILGKVLWCTFRYMSPNCSPGTTGIPVTGSPSI